MCAIVYIPSMFAGFEIKRKLEGLETPITMNAFHEVRTEGGSLKMARICKEYLEKAAALAKKYKIH
ncbi:MAG: hypothetical protein KKE71_01860, partial [Nanoarchaeota archaeon]|nr:hypothetical protein [Nanoarchaeota archaeon]